MTNEPKHTIELEQRDFDFLRNRLSSLFVGGPHRGSCSAAWAGSTDKDDNPCETCACHRRLDEALREAAR